jgi:hypothetical protein
MAADVTGRCRYLRVRGLRLFGGEDGHLLKAIGRGEFTLNGFRNRDLQSILFAGAANDEREKKRRSATMSRQIRMLRAHHLIHKIGKSHRYRLNDRGRQLVTALRSAQAVSIFQADRARGLKNVARKTRK